MGTFRIEVTATGGHGCQREKGDGEEVRGCGLRSCPDCTARAFVAELRAAGNSVNQAALVHWPGQESQVTDDLLSHIRQGHF